MMEDEEWKLWTHLEAERVDVLGGALLTVVGFGCVEDRPVAHDACRDQHSGYVHYPNVEKSPGEQLVSSRLNSDYVIHI